MKGYCSISTSSATVLWDENGLPSDVSHKATTDNENGFLANCQQQGFPNYSREVG